MNRIGKAVHAGWVLLAALCLPTFADGRPNVLVILTDDQRADTIAAYGNAHIDTPNIDRLVERGFSFRRNYCLGSPHGAVCVPSRAMFLSGRAYRAFRWTSPGSSPCRSACAMRAIRPSSPGNGTTSRRAC